MHGSTTHASIKFIAVLFIPAPAFGTGMYNIHAQYNELVFILFFCVILTRMGFYLKCFMCDTRIL